MCFSFLILSVVSIKKKSKAPESSYHKNIDLWLTNAQIISGYLFLLLTAFSQKVSGAAQPAAKILWRSGCSFCCEAESEAGDSPPVVSEGVSSIPCQEKGPPRNQ